MLKNGGALFPRRYKAATFAKSVSDILDANLAVNGGMAKYLWRVPNIAYTQARYAILASFEPKEINCIADDPLFTVSDSFTLVSAPAPNNWEKYTRPAKPPLASR